MISTKEYEDLYQVLNTTQQTVEKVFDKFLGVWQEENSNNPFRGCYTMSHLLRLNLLTKIQRLLAILIIYETYRSEGIKKNPFGGILFQIYNKSTDNYEKKFIAEILIDNKRDKYYKLKIEVLNEQAQVFSEVVNNREQMEALEKSWIESCPKVPLTQSNEIHNVVHATSSKDRKNQIPEQEINKQSLKDQQVSPQSFAANYLRPLPQFIEIKHSDFYWLTPGIVHDVSWDPTFQKNLKSTKVKSFLGKAQTTPLGIDEVTQLCKIIQEYPSIFWNDFNVNGINQMANKNPYVAGEIFCRLINNPKFEQYLPKLLHMKISTNSLHVMTIFATKCKLPNHVNEYYLNNIISQLLEMETNSQNEKLANLVAILGKQFVEELKWVDPKQVQEKAKKLLEKYSKSQLVANFVSLLI